MWDYSKFTNEAVEEVRQAVKDHDTKRLIEIHDRLGLSPTQYCCVDAKRLGEPQEWFEFFLTRKDSE